MDFYVDPSTSLTQNPEGYFVLVVLAIFISIIVSIYFLLKYIKTRESTPEYIEAQKEKITTQKDVQKLVKKLQLNSDNQKLLWKICKITKAKNILYSFTDENYLDSLFKEYYIYLQSINATAKEKYEIFKLNFLIYKKIYFSKNISSSKLIPLDTILLYPTHNGIFYQFKLIKNEKNALYLSVPENITEETAEKPEPLSKIAMLFNLQNKQQYALVTRVIQYLDNDDNSKYLLLNHSNTIYPQNRRGTKRFEIEKTCSFSAVEIKENSFGKNSFKPKENKYEGKIINLSEGGCKLLSNLPIKQKQLIYLYIPILNKTETILGQIVETKIDQKTGLYAIHIMFKNISIEQKVKLLSELYQYE